LWGLGLPLSEKQIPQVVENLESGAKPKEALETAALRPRQVRYQTALRPDKHAFFDSNPISETASAPVAPWATSPAAPTVSTLSAVGTLFVITAIRSHAALAPSRPHGIAPPPARFSAHRAAPQSRRPSLAANPAAAPPPSLPSAPIAGRTRNAATRVTRYSDIACERLRF